MKKLAIILLVLTIFISAIPAVQAETIASTSLSGVQIFPKDHIWNVPINTMPVDSRSAVLVNGLGASAYLGTYRGVPYNVVDNTVIHTDVSLLRSWSDFIKYPIPANPLIEPGGNDKHLIIVDKDDKMLYEFYKATMLADGTLSAQSGFSFDLSGYALRPKGYTTACEAGVAIFPGLVRYDEVSSGVINHALRVSVPATDHSYVWPARSTGTGSTDGRYPPMGQRYRLKASFDTSGYSPQSKVILEALKKYGMMVSGMNGETTFFQLTFAPDANWNTNDLGTLKQVHGSDFEAVDVSSLMINENSGQARTTSIVTPTPTPLPTPPAAAFTVTPTYLNVQCRDASTGTAPLTYAWNFGDGISSNLQSPAHTYAAAGTYSIQLTVTNTAGSNAVTHSVSVSAAPVVTSTPAPQPTPPAAVFTATPTYLNVRCTDASTGTAPLTYAWNFGDGTTSNLQSPAHTYAAAGTYSIQLTVTNTAGSSTVTHSVSVSAPPVVIPTSTKIGVVHGSHTWNVDYNGDGVWSGTPVDKTYSLGQSGDTYVTGDWNGDGITEIGVVHGSHTWNVDYNGNGTWNGIPTDRVYTLGQPGDAFVTGDWNNDGITEIGVVRGSHTWYVDYNGDGKWSGTPADRIYYLGQPGDAFVTGDWNNDGISEIGVYRKSTHLFYQDYNGDGVWSGLTADRMYNFGATGDTPISGTW